MRCRHPFMRLGSSWMDFFLIEIKKFLIFPVLFVKRFIAPSASVAPASSVYVASTVLYERRSFGLLRPLHNFLAVLVKEVQVMLAVLAHGDSEANVEITIVMTDLEKTQSRN